MGMRCFYWVVIVGFLFSCSEKAKKEKDYGNIGSRNNNDSTQKAQVQPIFIPQAGEDPNQKKSREETLPQVKSPTSAPPENSAGSSPDKKSSDGPIPASLCKTAFDQNKIPGLKTMVKVFLDEYGYTSDPSPKALAINDEGFGIPVILSPGTPIPKVKKVALNRCSAITGGGPCRVIAVGDMFCPDGLETPKALQKSLNLKDLPFGTDDSYATTWVATLAADYQVFQLPKAVAISLDGGVFWDFATNSNGNGTVRWERSNNEEAARIALEACEMTSTLSPCTLFAVGDTVVFDPAAMNWTQKIDFTPRVLAKPALITPNIGFDTFWATSWFPSGNPELFRGAIFVSQDGASWINNTGVPDIQTKANCESLSYRNRPCFKFVQNGRVVATPANALQGLNNPAIHCNAMPRASCEAHFKAGCTVSGLFNIISNGKVSEMMCTF